MGRQRGAARELESAAADFARHLEASAVAYFRTPGVPRVRRLKTQERRNATLFYFDVRLAGSSHPVVVKTPVGRKQRAGRRPAACTPLPDELRVLPISTAAQRGDLEHATLARIHQHFAGRDPRFGAIRVLDYLPERRALVMETCPDRNLADLYLRRIGPLRGLGSPPIGPALCNAGAWLRVYHGLPAGSASRERTPLRSEFLASIERMLDYLLDTARDGGFLKGIRLAIRARVRDRLPERLPLVPSHGDFVPRNVLVGPGGRVTVLDTRAQWLAPVYEDLARFRVALAASDLQLASPAWALDRDAPVRAGAEFLQGYFAEESPPLEVIRLFECQRLLAIRVAATHQHRIANRSRRWVKAILLDRRARYVNAQLDAILSEGSQA